MISRELKIKGMTCQHCVMSVEESLKNLKMLKVIDVQIGSAMVEYEAEKVTEIQLKVAVKGAGFVLVS
jgi:copper chaperone